MKRIVQSAKSGKPASASLGMRIAAVDKRQYRGQAELRPFINDLPDCRCG